MTVVTGSEVRVRDGCAKVAVFADEGPNHRQLIALGRDDNVHRTAADVVITDLHRPEQIIAVSEEPIRIRGGLVDHLLER